MWFEGRGKDHYIKGQKQNNLGKIPLEKRAAQCAMHGVWGRAEPQGSVVHNITLHFYKRLFAQLEPVTSLEKSLYVGKIKKSKQITVRYQVRIGSTKTVSS